MSSSLSSFPRKKKQQQQQQQQSEAAAASASVSAPASIQSAPHTSRKQQQQQTKMMKSSLSFSPNKKKNESINSAQSSVASAASAPVGHSSSSPQQPQQPPQSPPQSQSQQQPQQQSLPDQLTGMALQGSIELLKLASGISAPVVAPSLFRVIIPQLYNELRVFLSNTTPRRGKDWFIILKSSILHVIQIISTTPHGHDFLQRLQIWWFSFVTCIASPCSRQVIVDGMSCHVFLYKLLATSEFNAWLHQSVVTISRIIDALYLHKQIWYDSMTLISSWNSLWNDSTTISAMAEVTARLCLALEMEQVALLQQGQLNRHRHASPEGRGGDTKKSTSSRRERRRHERNVYQTNVYQKPILMTNPNATVEDVILSSLGVDCTTASTTKTTSKSGPKKKNADWSDPMSMIQSNDPSVKDKEEDDNMSLSSSTTASPLPCTEKDNDEDDDGVKRDNDDNHGDLHAKPVNVNYLRQHIIGSKNQQERQPQQSEDIHLPNTIASSTATTTLASSTTTTTTKKSHAENKQTATTDHADNDDHDDDDDMEDLLLVKTVVNHDDNTDIDDNTKLSLPLRKRNRALVQATGSNINEPNFDATDDDDDDSENNDNDVQHQSTTTPPLPLPEQQQQSPRQQLDGESSLEYFYRIMDQVLEKERKNGIEHLLTTNAGKMHQQRGRVRRRPMSLSSRQTIETDKNNESDWPISSTMTSVWEQFKQSMAGAAAASAAQPDKDFLRSLPQTSTSHAATQRRSKIMIVGLLAIGVVFLLTFSAFGFYGFYTFFFGTTTQIMPKNKYWRQQQQQQDEVVIRIIRQVVHVDAATGHVLKNVAADGNDLSSTSSSFSLLQEPHVMDKISECVAKVMDD